MKKSFYNLGIALLLSFSAFCFFYLNSQVVTTVDPITSQLVTPEVSPEKKDEIYFPDLAVVEKISVLVYNILKVF